MPVTGANDHPAGQDALAAPPGNAIALAPVAPTSDRTAIHLSDVEVNRLEVTKIMLQQKTIVDLRFSTSSKFFPWLAGLGERVSGTFSRWAITKELKASVDWDDGGKDVLTLHEMLLPVYEFKLQSYKNGKGAPVLRGTARAEHERETAEPKEVVKITYKDGALEKVQEWTHVEPEAISVDYRTQQPYATKINRLSHTINSPFKMFRNAMYPPELLAMRLKYHNQRLAGTKSDPKTTSGELVRVDGYKIALGLCPGEPVEDMWRWNRRAKEITAPPNMGQHGLTKDRFLRLLRLDGHLWELGDEDDRNNSDPWRFSLGPEKIFNKHMPEVVTPGSHTGPDESMAAHTGEQSGGAPCTPNQIPIRSFVPRKPKTTGGEVKTFAEADAGMIIQAECQVGAKYHGSLEFYDEWGHQVGQLLRLTKPWHNSDRVVGGDSWSVHARA